MHHPIIQAKAEGIDQARYMVAENRSKSKSMRVLQ